MRYDLTLKKEWQTHPADISFPLTAETYVSVVSSIPHLILRRQRRVNNPVAIWESLAQQEFTKQPKPEICLFQVQTS